MALTDLPMPIIYPGYFKSITGTISLATDVTLDAAGEYISHVFSAPQDMTIAHVGFKTGTVSGSPTAQIRIETVGADGLPTGTLWGANTNATTATLTSSAWIGTDLTASASISRGQIFCVKILYASGTSIIVQRLANLNNQISSMPYSVVNTGTPTKQRINHTAILGVGSSSTSFYPLRGTLPVSALPGSGSFNNTNGDRRGLRFSVPFKARACGIRMQGFASSGNFNVAIYDDSGNEVSSSSTAYDADHSGLSTSGHHTIFFDNPAIILPGTFYRAVLEPTSSTNITFQTFQFPSADHRSGSYGGVNNHYTTYTTGGGWIDTATDTIPVLDVAFDQFDVGAGAYPGLQDMSGGIVQRDTSFFFIDDSVSDIMVSANASTANTSIQRIPAVEVLSSTQALVFFAQKNVNAAGGDGEGMRLAMKKITITSDGNRMVAGDLQVISEPSNWSSGLGFHTHPHCKKIKVGPNHLGRVILIYNQNDNPSGLASDRDGYLNIWMRYSDDDGDTWSSGTKIFDAQTSFDSDTVIVPGSNGDFIEVPNGTYAGRLICPIYWNNVTGSDTGLMYSDDGGDTWAIAGAHFANGSNTLNRSENSQAWCPNNVIVETVREDGTAEIERELNYITMTSTTTFTPSHEGEIASFHVINCNASMLQIDPDGEVDPDWGVILWSGPTGGSTQTHRHTYRLRRSIDGGVTWDEYAPFPNGDYVGYNSIRMLNATEMLLAYESFVANQFNDANNIRLRIINLNTAFPD